VISIELKESEINARWLNHARTATQHAIDAWELWLKEGAKGEFTYTFNQRIWTAFKKWLLKYKFHNKCAYCETKAVQFYADAEHYRPKASVQVRERDSELRPAVCALPLEGGKAREMKHPGYFWLAYNWRNLLPACKRCNSGLEEEQVR
jgi:hypothetical protein